MIDMHVHSTASDGSVAPSELADRTGNFYVTALTDHDNCDGVDEFLSACAGNGSDRDGKVRLAGIELSVEPGEGYGKFHLLGLGIDHRNVELKSFLRKVLEGRNARNRKILERFAGIGIHIPADEIARYAHGEVLARPHFAAWLVDHGYSPDIRTAFNSYLTPDSPVETCCYVTRYHPDPAEAFAVIHAAGGVAVMAHPRYWTKDPVMLRTGLARLAASGLDGVEAVYQANEPEETIDHLRAAKEIGLFPTAGSDFHGAAKPTIPLGMDVHDERSFLEPFFGCLNRRRAAAGMKGVV